MYFPTGTIKQAQLAAIKHDREIIARIRAHATEKGLFRSIYILFRFSNGRLSGKGSIPSGESFDEYLERSEREIEAMQD